MKQIFVLLVILLFTECVNAFCGGSRLSFFPTNSSIMKNSIFMVEGYGNSQEIILGLNKNYKIYLKSGTKKINLVVTEICIGDFELTQAILKPEIELEAGLEYTMFIDSVPRYENMARYNETLNQMEPVTYEILSEKDIDKPIVSTRPKEIKKQLAYFGCGPASQVIFSNTAKDNSEFLVRTTVRNLTTKKETTYYILPDGDKIRVGHGMCEGAFYFSPGDEFEIAFSFMDASGNLTPWSGDRIKFTKPTEEIRSRDEISNFSP